MIRFGIIGTNWITEEFIRCGKLLEDFSLTAVYSRTEERAKEFASKHSAKYIFTDLEEMAKSDVIDAVYIASPNSLHAPQSILFLNNKKHVLCEKPMASNKREVMAMIDAAKNNNVLLMEAMKTSFLPNYMTVRENLGKIGKIRSSLFSYCQYSARYEMVKKGEPTNTFNPNLSSGSLTDIGVYCVYPAIQLFGKPKKVTATGVLIGSGVDGIGTLTLHYDHMFAVILHSKITNSHVINEIQGEEGTMTLDRISRPHKVEIHYRNGEHVDITKDDAKNAMYHEAKEFIQLIKLGKTESSINTFQLALDVMEVMDEARKQMEVVFEADQ